jgi:hypothetical protein
MHMACWKWGYRAMAIVRFVFFLNQNFIHLIKLHDLLKFLPVHSFEDTSMLFCSSMYSQTSYIDHPSITRRKYSQLSCKAAWSSAFVFQLLFQQFKIWWVLEIYWLADLLILCHSLLLAIWLHLSIELVVDMFCFWGWFLLLQRIELSVSFLNTVSNMQRVVQVSAPPSTSADQSSPSRWWAKSSMLYVDASPSREISWDFSTSNGNKGLVQNIAFSCSFSFSICQFDF